MDGLKTLAIAITAFAAGPMMASGLVVLAGDHVPFGAVVAFIAGLAAAVSLVIFGIGRSRRRTEGLKPGHARLS